MPNPVLAKYAKRANCSIEHVEQEWERAKEIARQKIGTTPGVKPPPKFWAYVNGIVQRSLKLKEGFRSFVDSYAIMEGHEFKAGDKVWHRGLKEVGEFVEMDSQNSAINYNAWVKFPSKDNEAAMVTFDMLNPATPEQIAAAAK